MKYVDNFVPEPGLGGFPLKSFVFFFRFVFSNDFSVNLLTCIRASETFPNRATLSIVRALAVSTFFLVGFFRLASVSDAHLFSEDELRFRRLPALFDRFRVVFFIRGVEIGVDVKLPADVDLDGGLFLNKENHFSCLK